MRAIGRHIATILGSSPVALFLFVGSPAMAVCEELPDHRTLRSALTRSVEAAGGFSHGHLSLHVSATVVGSDGTVCAIDMSVAYGGGSVDPGAAGASVADRRRSCLNAAVAPPDGDRIAVGAGFAESGHIRKDPPLATTQLKRLRSRALRQGF